MQREGWGLCKGRAGDHAMAMEGWERHGRTLGLVNISMSSNPFVSTIGSFSCSLALSMLLTLPKDRPPPTTNMELYNFFFISREAMKGCKRV